MTYIETAKRVLDLEAQALRTLSTMLDDDFNKAVDVILSCHGRVIVSGMGKSGHVGAKIVATLSSTGTRAGFVHPGEASHGDLGMVSTDDVVILLSNSGETSELADIISYIKRQDIKSIAITKHKHSTLGKSADITLCLPATAEACSLGLAPTTSTTATLALGDALAVALLESRRFSAEDFKKYHPGGKLGQQLLFVRDLMRTGDSLALVKSGTKVKDALPIMMEKSLGCVGVVDDADALIGIFTDGDLLRHVGDGLLDNTIDNVMTKSPIVACGDMMAGEVLNIFETKKISAVFVVDNAVIMGVLHFHDLLKAGVA